MRNVMLLRGLIFATAMFLLPSSLFAAQLSYGEKDTIFVGELKVQPSVIEAAEKNGTLLELKRAINSLDTQFINALSSTRVFQLVERKRKGDIELEQDFAAVAVDPNDKNIAQAGKMAGAKFAFLPQVDGFEDRSEKTAYRTVDRVDLNRKIFLSATVQVVDTTTGKLLPDAPSIQLIKTEIRDSARAEHATGSDSTIVEISKEMSRKLSHDLISILRPAKVLNVTGKQIMFNRGSDAGFSKGDTVEIYAIQNVKDEENGEIYQNEVPVGQAVIERLDKRQSFAMLSGDNLGIDKGCVVRPIKLGAKAESDKQSAEEEQQSPGSSEKPMRW
jgi:hypothetical protein